MVDPSRLLDRLNAIGRKLALSESAVALIALGSVGQELERLDRYSDLDFFVIARPGAKAAYLDDLSWLSDIAPVIYRFRNTADGYKLLYEDGVLCEFAVFEASELAHIPFEAGRIVWQAADAPPRIATPQHKTQLPVHSIDYHLGEALTNLFVGLLRDGRGEKLTGCRFIQHYAVNHLIALVEKVSVSADISRDPFDRDRRFEHRFPQFAPQLASFVQGYERNRNSARAIVTFLDTHFDINQPIKRQILALCQP